MYSEIPYPCHIKSEVVSHGWLEGGNTPELTLADAAKSLSSLNLFSRSSM